MHLLNILNLKANLHTVSDSYSTFLRCIVWHCQNVLDIKSHALMQCSLWSNTQVTPHLLSCHWLRWHGNPGGARNTVVYRQMGHMENENKRLSHGMRTHTGIWNLCGKLPLASSAMFQSKENPWPISPPGRRMSRCFCTTLVLRHATQLQTKPCAICFTLGEQATAAAPVWLTLTNALLIFI